MAVQLGTIGQGKPFTYTGSTSMGTVITYGSSNSTITLNAADWAAILSNFKGKVVPLGADFDSAKRAPGSIGEFLTRFTATSIATYVAAILEHESLAQPVPQPVGATVGGIWIQVF